MTIGTSYFVSRQDAIRYYKNQGDDAAAVDQKLKEGYIHVGVPPLKQGETLSIIDNGTRYAITDNRDYWSNDPNR